MKQFLKLKTVLRKTNGKLFFQQFWKSQARSFHVSIILAEMFAFFLCMLVMRQVLYHLTFQIFTRKERWIHKSWNMVNCKHCKCHRADMLGPKIQWLQNSRTSHQVTSIIIPTPSINFRVQYPALSSCGGAQIYEKSSKTAPLPRKIAVNRNCNEFSSGKSILLGYLGTICYPNHVNKMNFSRDSI